MNITLRSGLRIALRIIVLFIVAAALVWPVWNNWDAMRDSVDHPSLDRAPLSRTTELPDFSQYTDVEERKLAFFGFLQPMIEAENQRILQQRAALLQIESKLERGQALSQKDRVWLADLAEYYRVQAQSVEQRIDCLKHRVDIIPDVLIQIQAANETGWGQSRFAQNARNMFGQWCWSEGCGIVPSARPDGASHEVRYFPSVEESVRSYIRNLNTHPAYSDLRAMRSELRQEGQAITATSLTPGLLSYSERGEDYVIELNQMIRVNRPLVLDLRSGPE